uniref:Integral membrane protein n=1 Tax=Tetraselmis sp. GSL018 TaxID=582737 RepID=A0A061RPA1_9CHLO|mmetsp:Transcript_33859/g.80374  ORF Transcript_33859/g.80374 Transcript_33859/m.80374 type:complete len:444 (+) Transcript_33859:171-1502(+)
MGLKVGAGVSIGGLLFFGTVTSLFAKIVYELKGEGLDGVHNFHKPLFMCTVMFLGMSLCLPVAYLEQWYYRRAMRQSEGSTEPLLPGVDVVEKPTQELRDALLLIFPTVFDLIATVLMNVGLLWVTASVYQMMRGAEMIFAAILGITFLRRRLNKFHYLGILCCVAGISMVGSSSLLSGEGSVSTDVDPLDILLGMVLIILSQCVQAGQLTFEDYFLSELNMMPLKIVGYEGLIGFILMVGVLLPAAYFLPGQDGHGLHENTLDTLHMIANTPAIATVLVIDCLALLSYNFAGMSVTDNLGAIFRTVLETMRTLFVWIVDLILFYVFPMLRLGESWSSWSYLQAAGFCILVTGTIVYGRGNEEEAKSLVGAAAGDSIEAPPHADGPGAPAEAAPMPVPAAGASTPIAMSAGRSSYKATMTMVSGSLGTSYTAQFHPASHGAGT